MFVYFGNLWHRSSNSLVNHWISGISSVVCCRIDLIDLQSAPPGVMSATGAGSAWIAWAIANAVWILGEPLGDQTAGV